MIERDVLVVHDVVPDFIGDDPAMEAILANVRALVAAAHDARLPVFFAAPDRGTPGSDVPASLGIQPSDTVLRKPRYGAFFGTNLARELRRLQRDTVVICGISLAGGVETTVRDAFNHRLQSIVVADACLCRPIPDQGWGAVSTAEVERVTLSLLAQRFATVVATAELLDRWHKGL